MNQWFSVDLLKQGGRLVGWTCYISRNLAIKPEVFQAAEDLCKL